VEQSGHPRRNADAVPQRQPADAQPAWYVASIHTGKDRFAEQNLRQQGFVTFVLRQFKTVRHAGSTVMHHVPYFHDHLFVAIDLKAQRWQSVNSTPGIHSLVMRGERPAPVPPGFVERFLEASDTSFSPVASGPNPTTMGSGQLVNLVGLFDRLTARDRTKLLMTVMDGQFRLALHQNESCSIGCQYAGNP